VVEAACAGSVCFGLYVEDGTQVGFARVISDRATFAYLADVFVLPEQRGRGLSKWLVACVLEHPALQNLRRWMLATRDAHGLYERYGFTSLGDPKKFMEIAQPGLYLECEQSPGTDQVPS
jgi:GNAT superfamily N-acetyltransferase